MATLTIDGLLDLLTAGETVLFPTPRAAAGLKARFDDEQRSRGLRAWEPPRCLAWKAWTESLWSRLTLWGEEDRILLNRLQELSLWTEIIRDQPSASALELNRGSLRELAGLARSAYRMAAAHLPSERLRRLQRGADAPDARAFAAWAVLFEEHCSQARYISGSCLDSSLGEHLQAGTLPVPQTLHLAGFEAFTPAQTNLLQLLRDADVTVHRHDIATSSSPTALRASTVLSDRGGGLRWALRWIGLKFLRAVDRPPSIALILPDPGSERPELEPLLRDLLAPELVPVTADLSSTPWHFNAGPILSSVPVIGDALLVLRWTNAELSLDEIGNLLLSPFLAHPSSFEIRARYEMGALRRTKGLRPEMELHAFLHSAKRGTGRGVEVPDLTLFGKLNELAGGPDLLSGTGTYGDWSELVRKLLRSVGWPGPRPPNPEQFQATEAWESLLDQLATLDFSGHRPKFREFLQLLSEQAAETQAPAAIAGAALEILTLAEAEGCSFDAAVILRATDSNLPAPERLHPLLGVDLQRSLQLPGSGTALAHTRTRNRLLGLAARCQDVLMVSAAADENGSLRAAPLIQELAFQVMDAADLCPPLPPHSQVVPERRPEMQASLPLVSTQAHGGAKILELQAACGFRAFASLRLQAEIPESPSLGLDARVRGNILHKALEEFWKEVKSQAALRAMTTVERRAALNRAIRLGLERNVPITDQHDEWSRAYVELFEQKTMSLLERWLAFELKRGDFTVVSPEGEELIQVGPLQLKVRPDRIDQVKGGLVLVDYKTSSDLATSHWLGERPQAPQLPLYTLLGDADEIRGLAFGRLRPGKQMDWIGLQKEEGDLQLDRRTKIHDLQSQVAAWRVELDRLAQEFADGVTSVNPKSYPGTCKYCDQRLLCRLDAASLLRQADAIEEAEAQESADG